jgi:hypothetical protein
VSADQPPQEFGDWSTPPVVAAQLQRLVALRAIVDAHQAVIDAAIEWREHNVLDGSSPFRPFRSRALAHAVDALRALDKVPPEDAA